MKRTIQVRICRGERQHVAECLDFPDAIVLHLDGENLAEAGYSDNPTVIARMELPAVA